MIGRQGQPLKNPWIISRNGEPNWQMPMAQSMVADNGQHCAADSDQQQQEPGTAAQL
jgi:hypothetical protein